MRSAQLECKKCIINSAFMTLSLIDLPNRTNADPQDIWQAWKDACFRVCL